MISRGAADILFKMPLWRAPLLVLLAAQAFAAQVGEVPALSPGVGGGQAGVGSLQQPGSGLAAPALPKLELNAATVLPTVALPKAAALRPVQAKALAAPPEAPKALPKTADEQLKAVSQGAAEVTRSLGEGSAGERDQASFNRLYAGSGENAAAAAPVFGGSAAPSASKGLRRSDWSVGGRKVQYLAGGGFKDVLVHPDDPELLLTLFSQAGSEGSGSRVERDRELSRRVPLERQGLSPKVTAKGALEVRDGNRLRTVHYLVQERVRGSTLREAGRGELGLVRALFEKLIESRIKLEDRVRMADNIMVGSTRSGKARRAFVVDAGEAESVPAPSLMDRLLGRPDPLRAYYDEVYKDLARSLKN